MFPKKKYPARRERCRRCQDSLTSRATAAKVICTQYTSLEFGGRCRGANVRLSMGSVSDAYDNAMCESFFAILECELLARRRFTSQAEARIAIFSYIEG